PGSDELGSGIDLPDDVILAVEKRSNDYYFPSDVKREDKDSSTDSPVNLAAEGTTDEPTSQKRNATEATGRGVVLPDDVLIAVEKRADEYYFPPDANEDKQSSTIDSTTETVAEPTNGQHTSQKRDVTEATGQGIDIRDDVLVDVEKRADEFYFSDEKESPSNEYTSSGDHEKTQDSVNVSSASGRGDIPISTRAEPARPHGPTFGPGSGLTIPTTNDQETPDEASVGHGIDLPDSVLREVEKRSNEYYFAPEHASESPEASLDHTANPAATRNERKRDAETPDSEAVGDGISLPDDVVLEVEKRTNDYYFAGDHGQQTDVKSSSTQDQ
ncbi:hypothetical protein PENTCL1PPCAC_19310, partial [Pristionchus entomophagus]